MQTILKTFGSSALVSFLLVLPFMVMEVVNRRNYDEDFPFVLFFGMWQLLFAISLILLPVVRGRLKGNDDLANPVPTQEKALLTNPRSAAVISIAIYLSFGLLALLESLGWAHLDTLINGPDPEQDYLPGLFISLGLFWLTVTAAIIACVPVVRTVRAGGSLLAHPANLIIVVIYVSAIAFGLASLIVDQWPCFIGVPMCD